MNVNSRLGGVLFIGISLAVGYFVVYQPLHDAQHHASELGLSVKGAAFTPIIFLTGLGGLLFGRRFFDALQVPNPTRPGRKKLTPFGWGFAIVGLALGALLFFGMRSYLSSLGYDFH